MNIWDSEANVLVIPSNVRGVYGKGLALQAHQRYPESTEPYRQACWVKKHDIGRGFSFKCNDGKILFFLATKIRWQEDSEYAWIEAGLADLADRMRRHPLMSVALPPIGCGLGTLLPQRVRSIVNAVCGDVLDRIEFVGNWEPRCEICGSDSCDGGHS